MSTTSQESSGQLRTAHAGALTFELVVPGLAAREVAIGALGTVYALSSTGDEAAQALSPLIVPDEVMVFPEPSR